jgi:malate dehydrogenase (oxaloacetate-decarboxylating)(NADP+)
MIRMLGTARNHELNPEQRYFARSEDSGMPLPDVIKKYRPTMLLGVTAVGGLFTEEIIREMAAHCPRPIIFPLSNPTTKAECTAEQAFEWTDGQCIFASGSPFPPVVWKDHTYLPAQCNNMYIFPGLGLGATVCGAKKVTNRMLYIAAETLARVVDPNDLHQGRLFPPLSQIRSVSHAIAVSVVKEALRDQIATRISAEDAANVEDFVARKMYYPEYVPLVEKREILL